MSQTAPSDADPSADIITPPTTQSPLDDPDSPDVPLQPPLIPENLVLPQATEEMTTEDTAVVPETSEGRTDQPEPPAEGQVIECDQPVSLEPEAAEEDLEVCSTSLSGYH